MTKHLSFINRLLVSVFRRPFLWALVLFFTLAGSSPPEALAVEPYMGATDGVSIVLRNDGVLFQFGGPPFSPVTLPPSVVTPLHPEAAILTNVLWEKVFVPSGSPTTGGSFAVVDTSDTKGAVFEWYPNSSNTAGAQPTQVPGTSEVREVIDVYSIKLALTNAGTVFSFGGWKNLPATQVPGLANIKSIVGRSDYLALTSAGTVLFGDWDHDTNQSAAPLQVEGLSNIERIIDDGNGRYYYAPAQNGDLYGLGGPPAGTTGLSKVTKIAFMGMALFGLTQDGEVYYIPGSVNPSPIKLPLSNVKNIILPVGNTGYMFAILNSGEVYGWTMRYVGAYFLPNPPVLVNGLSNPKDIQILSSRGEYVALTDTKEVYTFGWDGVNNMLTATKHPTLSNIIAITRPHAGYELNPHFLALQEDGILCGWGDNSKGQLGATAPITVPITNPVCGIEDLIVDTTSPPTTTVPPSYTLTVTKAGNGIGTVTSSYNSSSEIIDCGTVCTADYVAGRTVMLNAREGAGSSFTGWTGNCIDAYLMTDPRMKMITINAPTTCIATFTKYSYPFTINKAGTGNGTVTASPGDLNCGATCNANYFQGDTLTLSAIPDIGSEFSGWSGKCASTNTVTTLAIDGPANCTATFDKVPDRILTITKIGTGSGTVTSSAGVAGLGINCGTLCQAQYAQKTPVTLKATPDRNSQFHGWAGGCAEQFTITSNLNCTATFDLITYPLQINHDGTGKGTVVSTPAGIDCGKDCAVDYITGTRVTLKAIPQLGATFSGWSGNCKGTNNPLQVTMNYPLTCVATFKADEPNIFVSPAAYEFKHVKKGTYLTKPFVIYNNGKGILQLGQINIGGTSRFTLGEDPCSNTDLAPQKNCQISVTFRPSAEVMQKAWLSIPSNDPDTSTMTLSLLGTGCSADPIQRSVSAPSTINFGTEVIGNFSDIKGNVSAYNKGCGALQIEKLTITGTHAADFSLKDQRCYSGEYGDANIQSSSSCGFTVAFSPTSTGTKEAQVNYTLTDSTVKTSPVQLKAEVVALGGYPLIEVIPMAYEFGNVSTGGYQSTSFIVKNIGKANLKVDKVVLTETSTANIREFSAWVGDCTAKPVPPAQQCYVSVTFRPVTVGNKQATMTVYSNASNTPEVVIPLTGSGQTPADCADTNVTIESKGDPANNRWDSEGAWLRQPNSTGPNRPTETDVVRIKSGHTILGNSSINVRTLCIDSGGTLESNPQSTALLVYAKDAIENQGTISGRRGADEQPNQTVCTSPNTYNYHCAQRGTSLYLSVNRADNNGQKPLFYNAGVILAGAGGAGKQYGALGGDVYIQANGFTNVPGSDNGGFIGGGKGGDITAAQLSGKAGNGGRVNIWGGPYLNTLGNTWIYAGNGGNCTATTADVSSQSSGDGGELRLNASRVSLQGKFETGKAGLNCGQAGNDGLFNADPNIISLEGANTKIEGGDVTIYGGKDWVLDLSKVSGTVLTATGNITLAVGEGGMIDLRGSTGTLLKAGGQVNLFSDEIMLDEGVNLADLMEAADIVVGPNKIIRDVTLNGADNLFGEPGATLPITLNLANSSPESDTYTLTVTDSAGWELSPLPAAMTVPELGVEGLTLTVKLPATLEATDVITVTAISQADPNVKAVLNVQVTVATADMIPVTTSSVPTTGTTSGEPSTDTTNQVPTAGTDSVPVTIPGSTTCSSTNVITVTCNNHGQVLRDATVASTANLAGGTLAGTIINQGWISQVTLQAGATLTGGKLTGFITNAGTLADFDFVGALVTGGTLAGTVTNSSRVGGMFQDVQLAPNTHIKGGRLKGNIVGDVKAPALLENLKVEPGSKLTGVIIGKGVKLPKDVTLGEGVRFENEETPPPTTSDATTTVSSETTEASIEAALFESGIAVNGEENKSHATVTVSDEVKINGQITVASKHLGQTVEIVVYVAYWPPNAPAKAAPVYVMVDSQGKILPWDEAPAKLVPFQRGVVLKSIQEVEMYSGKLVATGKIAIFFGYRLEDGTLVSSPTSMEVTVTE